MSKKSTKWRRGPTLGPVAGLLILVVFFLLSSRFNLTGDAPEARQPCRCIIWMLARGIASLSVFLGKTAITIC